MNLGKGEWQAELARGFFKFTLRDKSRAVAVEHLETMPVIDACLIDEDEMRAKNVRFLSDY